MTHDEALRTQTRTALDLLRRYHTSLAGTIIADEYIGDLSPSRGSELCIAAEILFSLANIYQYLGDNDIADWAEQVAFNALPVAISPDWWSHQYVQQENQVSRCWLNTGVCELTACLSPGLVTSPRAVSFGTTSTPIQMYLDWSQTM